MAELVKKLQKLGWSAEWVDICWLDCDVNGHRREVDGNEIILCRRHIEELENASKGNYAIAAYPASEDVSDYWWPWRDIETGEFEEFLD